MARTKGIGLRRLSERLVGGDGDEGAERLGMGLDAVEVVPDELDGRHLAAAQQLGLRGRVEVVQLRHTLSLRCGPRSTRGDWSVPSTRSTHSLVTGATGYVGGRLVPELLDAGHRVRVMVRDERKARAHVWSDDVDIAVADATERDQVAAALEGIDVAYFLLHSIGTGDDFAETERQIAETFASEAKRAGVRRIVYLGGMVPEGEELSEHLRSREEVGDVLLESGVPTAVLQAGVVIGSGSASFEMLRYLTERLPVMVTPKWVHTRIQPIAIRDVLHYLVGCADLPAEVDRRFDIGGPDVLTYFDMMQRYAAVAGLPKRRVLPVPVLSPSLSSHWVGLITPVPASLARPLSSRCATPWLPRTTTSPSTSPIRPEASPVSTARSSSR